MNSETCLPGCCYLGMERIRGILSVLSFAALAVLVMPAACHAATGAAQLGPCSNATKIFTEADGYGKTLIVGTTTPGGATDCPYDDSRTLFAARLNLDGSLDSSYGDGGVEMLGHPIASRWSPVASAAIDSEDRLVIYVSPGSTSADPSTLIRLTKAGKPDPTFGGDGEVTSPLVASGDYYVTYDLAVSADGGLVISGDSGNDSAISKLNEDGTADSSFNSGDPVLAPSNSFGAVTTDSANNVYAAFAFTGFGGGSNAHILRFKPDGQPDPTYGGPDGIADIPSPNYPNDTRWDLNDLSVGRDGTVRLLGSYQYTFCCYTTPQRFQASTDPAGNTTPEMTTYSLPLHNGNFGAGGFDVTRQGKTLVAVQHANRRDVDPIFADGVMMVARFLPDGSLDPSFGGGTGYADRDDFGQSQANSVSSTPDGGVTIGGIGGCIGLGDPQQECPLMTFARFTPEGKPDARFGGDGVVTLPDVPCTDQRDQSKGPDACATGPLRRPKIDAGFLGKGAGSRLVLKITPVVPNPAKVRPWQVLKVQLPRALSLKAGGLESVKAYSGTKGGPRLPAAALRDHKLDGRVFSIYRSIKFQNQDSIRISIPTKVLRSVRHKDLGKSVTITATYTARDAYFVTGKGRIRIPR